MSKEDLIRQAVEAHEAAQLSLVERRKAFQRALAGPVSVRELAEATGLTPDKVRGIKGR